MEDIVYYLVLEKRLGDYNIVDINKLDICTSYCINDLSAIDLFTCRFSTDELKDAIKRSNVVKESYLNGYFKIISSYKHRLPVLTKEKYDIIKNFQSSDEKVNIDFKNKLYGSYKKIVEKNFKNEIFKNRMLKDMNDALKNSNKKELFLMLERLPYRSVRDFYFKIYDEYKNN